MRTVRTVTRMAACRELWQGTIPRENLADLWEVRDCFQRHYRQKPYFVVCEDAGGICGFLPLSWQEETGSYLYFPGETWQGKTWLEQNRLLVRDQEILQEMLGLLPGPYHLRYLRRDHHQFKHLRTIDEIGYVFLPPRYNYDFEAYLEEFSPKSAKRLQREIAALEARDCTIRLNEQADFETMIELNLQRFGADSYFADPRFLGGLRSLFRLFAARGCLRLTALLLAGQVAAVDLGCVHRGTYTLLAGGTSAAFPGVAKLINMQHMRWACTQRLDRVDFLCGDFNWKELFHLTRCPLYVLSGSPKSPGRRLPAGYAPWEAPEIGATSGGVHYA